MTKFENWDEFVKVAERLYQNDPSKVTNPILFLLLLLIPFPKYFRFISVQIHRQISTLQWKNSFNGDR